MADESGAPQDDMDVDRNDALAATGRAIASLVPMVGGVIREALTKIIPN